MTKVFMKQYWNSLKHRKENNMTQICENNCNHYGRCLHQRIGGVCVGWEPYPDDDDEDPVEKKLERAMY